MISLRGIVSNRKNGGCARTRTVDPLIKSQLLYQLSYTPARRPAWGVREGADHTQIGGDGKGGSSPGARAAAPGLGRR